MDKNEQMAKSILKAVGGTENIKAATHCMTRLRLSLKDDKIPVDDEIKNIDGVIGVNRTETQFQIIIGPSVAKVYEAVCKQGEFNSISETSEAGKEEKNKKKISWKTVGKRILNYNACKFFRDRTDVWSSIMRNICDMGSIWRCFGSNTPFKREERKRSKLWFLSFGNCRWYYGANIIWIML